MSQDLFYTHERRARDAANDMLDIAMEIAHDRSAKNGDRLRAVELVLDRGHGKPTQAVIALPARRAIAQQLANMSEEDLLAQLAEARAKRALPANIDQADVQEAEFVDAKETGRNLEPDRGTARAEPEPWG